MDVFTILEIKGEHGNVLVNEVKNELTELHIYTIFRFLKANSIIFRAFRKYARSLYKKYCNRMARHIFNKVKVNDDVFLSFGGEFSELYTGKTIITIDDCYFTDREIKMLQGVNVKCIIVTTDAMKNVYESKYNIAKSIYVIPTGVRIKGRDRLEHNGFNTLYYGHIINANEIETFNAIQEKMKNKEGFKLTVAGSFIDGVAAETLDKDINFLGHISHESVLELLGSTDVGLYVRHDYFPLTLWLSAKTVEMMSFGVPIIATETRTIAANSGWCLPEDQIPDQVLWCYEHPEEIKALGQKAKEYAKRFESPQTIAQYRSVISDVANL